ncbi:hypothetical protein HDU98_010705 [Podochytrium sp. JEL0797]|nr:hypothetical protein HDU98_010705 [Podochytrium sp. JEL0797]
MTNTTAPEEVQVMPGVYLTTFTSTSVNGPHSQPKPESIAIKTLSGVNVDLDVFDSDNAEILQQEIARLRLSVQKLLESNHLLKEFMATDPDPEYPLAISENVQIIDKRIRMIKMLMQKLAAVSIPEGGISGGPCGAELAAGVSFDQPAVVQSSSMLVAGNTGVEAVAEDAEEDGGVYL